MKRLQPGWLHTWMTSHLDAVGAPASQLRGGCDVLLEPGRELRQIQEDVAGGPREFQDVKMLEFGPQPPTSNLQLTTSNFQPDDRLGAAELALWVDELGGVEQVTTLVTLISTRIL